MSLTNYVENQIINWLRGQNFASPPGTLYLALFNAAPGEGGATASEVSGGNYNRRAINLSAPPSPVSNTNTITYPQASAAWGEISAVGLMSGLSAGNVLAQTLLPASQQKHVGASDIVEFGPGSVVFNIN